MNHGLLGMAAVLRAALSLRAAVYAVQIAGEMMLAVGHIVHCVHSSVRVGDGAVAWTINEGGVAWFVLSMVLLTVAIIEIGWLAWKVVQRMRTHRRA